MEQTRETEETEPTEPTLYELLEEATRMAAREVRRQLADGKAGAAAALLSAATNTAELLHRVALRDQENR